MGDKSPRSKLKDQKQTKNKNAARQAAHDQKQAPPVPPAKPKK